MVVWHYVNSAYLKMWFVLLSNCLKSHIYFAMKRRAVRRVDYHRINRHFIKSLHILYDKRYRLKRKSHVYFYLFRDM